MNGVVLDGIIFNVSIKSETGSCAVTLLTADMFGLFPTIVMDIPAPAVKLGVRSLVKVLVVMPSSHEILEAFNLERFSGSDTRPVFVMVATPATLVTDIPAPAAMFGVRSHVRVLILALVICAVPLSIEKVGGSSVNKLLIKSIPYIEMFGENKTVVGPLGLS